MNKKIFALLPLLICLAFQGCVKDKVMMTYTILKPVYKDKAEVYANIKTNPAVGIKAPGKIFLYGNYIFLNDVDKGVHVIDNSNPSAPLLKGFINIPGNIDIAVRGNTLYADLYSDLVVVDITDPLQARFVKYIPNIFPLRQYSNGFVADSSRIIVNWIRKDTSIRLNSYNSRDYLLSSAAQSATYGGPTMGAVSTATGIAGSMARFALVNNYLYTVNNSNLTSFDISNSQDPVQRSSKQVGWNIETIYPFQQKLFIGSATGIFIYDLANPASPTAQGQFNHARFCDPVIADGNFAYSTLRSGATCGGTVSQLDVINIADITRPFLVRSYPLSNPYGLSKDNNLLFVCDGTAGLRVFDASNPSGLLEKKNITDLFPYDVIAYNGNLVVTTTKGLYQYSYTSAENIVLRSRILVNN